MKMQSSVFIKPFKIVIFSLFIIYTVLGLFGYGNDNDTYGMLSSGRNMWLNGNYHYSRGPGNFVPEMIIGGASLIGGYILTNLFSAILGAATLLIFWQLLNKVFSDSNALFIVLIVGLNPYFIIASSSSMDYVYCLFFCMSGIQLLTKRSYFFAAFLFAFAASSRLSIVLIIGIIYLYYLYIRYKENNYNEMTRLFYSGCLLILLTILFFVPSYIAAGCTFDFFAYNIGDWTFFGYLSRFVYKNIYLFGLLPLIYFSVMITWKIINNGLRFPFNAEVFAGIAIVVVSEILFFKIPIEISYLLPLLFVIIPLVVLLCRPHKITMYIFVILTISYSFIVNPDFLDRKYNTSGEEAIDANVGLFMRRGVVFDDVLRREKAERLYSPNSHK